MKDAKKQPIFIGMGKWADYFTSIKFVNELIAANDWVLPLMQVLGIPASELTTIMASTDKRLVMLDYICRRLAEGRKDLWLPSVSRKLVEHAEKQLDEAVQGIIEQQRAWKGNRQRLADVERHHEEFMANPEPFLHEDDKEIIRQRRARRDTKGIEELLTIARELHDQRHARVLDNIETAAEEIKGQALVTWENICKTSYDLTKLMAFIDTDQLQAGRLVIDKEKVKQKHGTWARTDNEQLLFDMLSKVCEMLNDLHLDNDPKTVFEHMTESVEHRTVRVRHDLEKDYFKRTAKGMKI